MTVLETPAAGLTPRPAAGTNRPHGYARAKLDGCHCYTCRLAVSHYNEARGRAIAYGTWQPFVDAEPVRQHIARLRESGLGLRTIAQHSGVDRQILQSIVSGRPERGSGPQRRVRPTIAQAVLDVEASLWTTAPSTPVDSTGTLRRLQALVAIGWPQARLAARLGWTATDCSRIMRSPRLVARSALAVRELYAELWDQDPQQHGVTKQAYVRARNAAAAAGWPPPAAWDDDELDDPTYDPAAHGLPRMDRAEARRMDIEHLISFGLSNDEIARRLDLSVDYVRAMVRGLRQDAA